MICGRSKCLTLWTFSKLYPLLPEASGYVSAALEDTFQVECFRTMLGRGVGEGPAVPDCERSPWVKGMRL